MYFCLRWVSNAGGSQQQQQNTSYTFTIYHHPPSIQYVGKNSATSTAKLFYVYDADMHWMPPTTTPHMPSSGTGLCNITYFMPQHKILYLVAIYVCMYVYTCIHVHKYVYTSVVSADTDSFFYAWGQSISVQYVFVMFFVVTVAEMELRP